MSQTRTALATAGLLALLAASAAVAQPMYRVVGPDGRVTYTDRAPNEVDTGARVSDSGQAATPGAGAIDTLPYALRQAATRYPVVLYTGNDCVPCVSGRNLLINRGVPFAERTVSSQDDVEALKRLTGEANLPLLTVGAQHLKGFSDVEWSQYLDAAGYPKQSQLPANYQRPAATPLVARSSAVAPNGSAPSPERAPRPAAVPPPPSGPTPSNPAGIIF